MNLQPTLEGQLLRLRPLTANDFEPLFAVSSDPLLWEQHPERHRYKRDVFEKFFQGALDSKGALVATDNNNNEIIGSSRYNQYDPANKQIEVGYTFLARRCWQHGFNREMKKLMLIHAFQHVQRVLFYIGAQNQRSRTAIEKIGARLIQEIQRTPKEGATYTGVVYALDKNEFDLARF